MWSGQQKVWIHYRHDIMAADVSTAIMLSAFLRHTSIHKLHTHYLEVIDLQRYKVIKQPKKVQMALKERSSIPFVFVAGKN